MINDVKTNNSKDLNAGRITCTIEYSGNISIKDFINELEKLPFNPKFISYNYSESSYIIQNKKTRVLINELKEKLKKKKIFLCGRFAEWEYFNMDAAIKSAIDVCENAIS